MKRLREEAARKQASAKVPVLTKAVQAQFVDLQALIDRYLDDEVFKGFSDAMDKMKSAPAPAPKARVR